MFTLGAVVVAALGAISATVAIPAEIEMARGRSSFTDSLSTVEAMPECAALVSSRQASTYNGSSSSYGQGFGGLTFSAFQPSSDALGPGSGIGIGVRGFGNGGERGGRPQSEYVWAVYAEGMRFEDEATSGAHVVNTIMFALGIELIPSADVYLRTGLGFVGHDSPDGEQAIGAMADLTLGWMVPIGSIDLSLELRQLWAKPGDVELDSTAATVGVFYLW